MYSAAVRMVRFNLLQKGIDMENALWKNRDLIADKVAEDYQYEK